MPAHRYPTSSTHAANLRNGSKRTNGQEGVPAQPKDNNIKLENAIIDNDTGGALEYIHLIKREEYREVWKIPLAKNWTNWHKEGPRWPLAPIPYFSKISGNPSQPTQRRHIWTVSRGFPTAKGGFNSLWGVTESNTQEMSAHQRRT